MGRDGQTGIQQTTDAATSTPRIKPIPIPAETRPASLHLQLEILEDRIELDLPPVQGPQTMAWLCPIAQWLSQQIMTRHLRQLAEAGIPLACRAGCSHCCHMPVPLSVPEAMFLADWLESLPARQAACIRQRFGDSAKMYHRAASRVRSAGRVLPTRALMRLASRQPGAGKPCPLLWQDMCTQYLTRPIACGEHISRIGPPDCAPSEKAVRTPLSMLEVLIRTSARLQGNVQEIVPLRRLFAWADTHRRRWSQTFPAERLLATFLDTARRVQQEDPD
jgi:hypothetical protein